MRLEHGLQDFPKMSVAALSSYLARSGWSLLGANEQTTMWRRITVETNNTEDIRVVLPISDDVTDYGEYQERALRAIAYSERRPVPDVRSEILFGPSDILAVRLTPPTPAGEAPLTLARDTLDGLRNLVIGTAAGLSAPGRPVPPTYRPRADAFANTVRVWTSPGSFIVNAAFPLSRGAPMDEGSTGIESFQAPDGEAYVTEGADSASNAITNAQTQGEIPAWPPFGRLVSARMRRVAERSVELAIDVAAGRADLHTFEDEPARTGNALELEALVQISGPERSPYTIRFSSSPSVGEEHRRPGAITVVPEVVSVINDAAGRLRTPRPIAGAIVVGRVVGLVRERTSQIGEITVDGRIGDGPRHKFRAHLEAADYDLALRAHRRALEVVLVGDVVMRGNFSVMERVGRISVNSGLEDE